MALVQSGWFNWYQSTSGQTLNSGSTSNFWIFTGDSVNQMVGRDGAIKGAGWRNPDSAMVARIDKFFFAVFRPDGSDYELIGKSPEYNGSDMVVGNKVFDFSGNPIENVLSTDIFALVILANSTQSLLPYVGSGNELRVNDSGSAKLLHGNSNKTTYSGFAFGDTFTLTVGAVFCVIQIAPYMDPPKVIGVGDSISEGYGVNVSHKRNYGSKSNRDAFGAFLQTACRTLGWGYECGVENVSNRLDDVLTYDLKTTGGSYAFETVWSKSPEIIAVHCGVNDIYDGSPDADWSTMEGRLNSILSRCRSYDCKLILTSIFPWTGNDANTTGTHAQNTIRDERNAQGKTWAAKYADVIYVDLNRILGRERIKAKSGDGTPTDGNLWDLHPDYIWDGDTLGIHLSKTGAVAAGSAIAALLRAYDDNLNRHLEINARRNLRVRYQPIETENTLVA